MCLIVVNIVSNLNVALIWIICLIHSKEINHPIGSSLNKRALKALHKADYVIANSRFTKELAIKLGVKITDQG